METKAEVDTVELGVSSVLCVFDTDSSSEKATDMIQADTIAQPGSS